MESLSYHAQRTHIESELETLASTFEDEKISEMFRYALFPAGKRVRPSFLCELTAALSSGKNFHAIARDLIRAAAAVELVHCASLVHDDLPSIDNDLLRRGKAAFHVQYGEGSAVLMGDLIASLAFVMVARIEDRAVQATVLTSLSKANSEVQIGQLLDIQNVRDVESIKLVHALKTASLFRACGEIAASLASCSPVSARDSAISLSYHFGLLFQAMNDHHDVKFDEQVARVAGSDIVMGRGSVEGWTQVERMRYFTHLTETIQSDFQRIFEAVGADFSGGLNSFLMENLATVPRE